MAIREQSSMLPDLLLGLSLLLTTIMCLKDSDCMVGLRNALQLLQLHVRAVHTQTLVLGQYLGLIHPLCCISI